MSHQKTQKKIDTWLFRPTIAELAGVFIIFGLYTCILITTLSWQVCRVHSKHVGVQIVSFHPVNSRIRWVTIKQKKSKYIKFWHQIISYNKCWISWGFHYFSLFSSSFHCKEPLAECYENCTWSLQICQDKVIDGNTSVNPKNNENPS